MSRATPEGTRLYANLHAGGGICREHFREAQGLWLSSIGIGTYLGNSDDTTDELYRSSVVRAVEAGCNVIDTGINYRCQRSEQAIGHALRDLAAKGVGRDQVVVATKGGYIPFEGEPPTHLERYLEDKFYSTGILAPSDLVGGCHAMTPRYLENQIERSLNNLGIETIDIYYVHNPEVQLSEVSREDFAIRVRAAFERLEKAAADGKIRFYGTATWNGYRVACDAQEYLSVEDLVRIAQEVAGEGHRFRFIQVPFNLAMTEALSAQNQPVRGNTFSTFIAADDLGITVISSASLAQGRLTRGLPNWLGNLLKGLETDAQRSIQFARSAPGLTTALVGMQRATHVRENMAVARVPPTPLGDFLGLFEVDGRL